MRGGQAYLDKEMVAGFHHWFPMSLKLQAVLENHLNVIKESVKPFVKVSISTSHGAKTSPLIPRK